jgi:hypothetical protein
MVPPVLLIIFNRPDVTKRVMSRVQEVQPSRLFVAADGPRPDHPEDHRLCEEARTVAGQITWECDVRTLFRDQNIGLKQAVSSAITWFFEHVDSGIILEDDCVPHFTFFRYCAELLDRYQHDERIMGISGNDFQPEGHGLLASYYFSAFPHCWGWATWKRAWTHYDGSLQQWPTLRDTKWLNGWLGSGDEVEYWTSIFDRVYRNEIDSWAYPWTYSCWVQHGLTILPKDNLVSNIGFDERATHTKNPDSEAADMPVRPLEFPLEHPASIVRHYQADRYTSKHHYRVAKPRPGIGDRIRARIPDGIKSVLRPLAAKLNLVEK